MMRKLAILTFQTLDGVMQAPGDPKEDFSGGFTQGGWAKACWSDVMEQVEHEAMAEPYDLLLGRTTYEIFASAFAKADNNNAVTAKLNNAKKYVVTSHLKELQWQNSQPLTGDIVAEIVRLKQDRGPLLQVHGSWQLVQTLITNRLIDEFRLWTFPVVLGSGKHLFSEGVAPSNLKLIKSATTPSGALMTFYQYAQKAGY